VSVGETAGGGGEGGAEEREREREKGREGGRGEGGREGETNTSKSRRHHPRPQQACSNLRIPPAKTIVTPHTFRTFSPTLTTWQLHAHSGEEQRQVRECLGGVSHELLAAQVREQKPDGQGLPDATSRIVSYAAYARYCCEHMIRSHARYHDHPTRHTPNTAAYTLYLYDPTYIAI
jgi:hypothetical protein